MSDFDTRMNIKTIIDYGEMYGTQKELSFADELIKDIPSVTLINYIAGFNIQLYLKDNGLEAHNIQIQLLNALVVKAGTPTVEQLKEVFQKYMDRGNWPVVIWPYSNLLFYELVFRNYNTLPLRDLTGEEAKRVLDAYLVINSVTSSRFKISGDQIHEAAEKGEIESILLPNFIYQKDYSSTTDFSNQITRSIKFFNYLENSDKFKTYVQQYYRHLKVRDSKDLVHNILTIFTQVGIGEPGELRKQIIPLDNIISLVNIDFINTLSINESIASYTPDNSFRTLRKKMLYYFDRNIYFLLDINFLIDQLYKAQVFGFKEFIESQGYKGNFLSVKGKEFMEDIYFRHIMERCFSSFIHLSGDEAKKSDGNEVCDYYIRKETNVLLIEFKDVLLAADLKEQTLTEPIYQELDKKFYENQKKDPKGIQQLSIAVNYLEANAVDFDPVPCASMLNIYPVVVYTDLSFGYEGVNKILKKKFRELISQRTFSKVTIKDVTFINLNYFEVHEDFLKQGLINIFELIDNYQTHTLNEDYSTTPFEVYGRFYLRANVEKKLGNPSFMLEVIKEIIPDAMDNLK